MEDIGYQKRREQLEAFAKAGLKEARLLAKLMAPHGSTEPLEGSDRIMVKMQAGLRAREILAIVDESPEEDRPYALLDELGRIEFRLLTGGYSKGESSALSRALREAEQAADRRIYHDLTGIPYLYPGLKNWRNLRALVLLGSSPEVK